MGTSNSCCYRRKDDTLEKTENHNKKKIITINKEEKKRGVLIETKLEKVSPESDTKTDDSPKAEPDLSFSTPHIQQKLKSLLIHNYYFYFENLEISYKLCDDFGLSFRPKLIVKIHPFDDYEIRISSDDKALDTSFNAPQRTERSSSQILSISHSESSKKKNSNNVYTFNHIFQLKSEDFEKAGEDLVNVNFNSMILTVSVVNEKNSDMNGKFVVIGEIKIPIHQITNKDVFEGRIPLRTKYTKIIGYLDTRIEMISYYSGTLPIKLDVNQFTEKVDPCKTIFNEYPIIPYEFLPEDIKMTFLTKDPEIIISKQEEESQINLQLQLSREIEDMSYEELSSVIITAISNNKQILIYSIINYLYFKLPNDDEIIINKSLTTEQEFIKNLFEELERSGYAVFKAIPELIQENLNYSLLLVYFSFLYKLVIFLRKLELEHECFLTIFNFDIICNIVIECFYASTKLFNELKEETLNEKYFQIGREISLWLLNCLNVLILPNLPPSKQQTSNKEAFSKLYNVAYTNCIKVISKLKYIVATFIDLREDGEISSLIVRILRKSIRMGMDYKNSLLPKNDRNKIVSNNIKISLVLDEKYSFFLTMLQICFSLLKHYPEIYSNILIILNQLSMDFSNKKLIFYLIKSISLENFRNSFNNYRGKLKYISKQINSQFYTFFYHISVLLEDQEANEEKFYLDDEEMNHLVDEIKTLFKMKINNKKIEKSPKLDNFLLLKTLDLQEIFSNIAKNFSKNPYTSNSICDKKCYFILFLIEFIIDIKKETIVTLLEKTKNKAGKDELAFLYINSVVNIISCFDNINKSNETKQYFLEMISLTDLNKAKLKTKIGEILQIFESNFNVDQSKLKGVCGKFIENLDTYKGNKL